MQFLRNNWKIVLAAFFVVLIMAGIRGYQMYELKKMEISYTEFVQMLEHHQVKKVTIRNFSRVSGEASSGGKFVTNISPDDQAVVDKMLENRVDVTHKVVKSWQSLFGILVNVVFLLVFVAYIYYARNIGKMKNAQFKGTQEDVLTFADVAGCTEAKQELQEVVDFLKSPEKFNRVGAKIPKGVLLSGPPGTGKTLLAKAVAGEAKVPFYCLSGSDFVEVFAGVGAARFRSLFKEAKENAPCIIFIDEIDSIGLRRGESLGGADTEREQALNQLLVGMDGFEANIGVIVLAGTNRPDVLDPALLRSGRFDRKIIMEKPDLKSRQAILAIHAKEKPVADDIDWQLIARRTAGFTGADLANLLNEAAIIAGRKGQDKIFLNDIEDCIDKVAIGVARTSCLISEAEKKIIAYHEGGHALIAKLLGKKVERISVIPRGQALGYVLQNDDEEKKLLCKDELLDQMAICLAGRAAESLVFGQEKISNGASNDIQVANNLARQAVCHYGMSRDLQEFYLDYDFKNRQSEHFLKLADEAVCTLLQDCRSRADDLLANNFAKLEKLVSVLLEKETLTEQDLDELGIFKED